MSDDASEQVNQCIPTKCKALLYKNRDIGPSSHTFARGFSLDTATLDAVRPSTHLSLLGAGDAFSSSNVASTGASCVFNAIDPPSALAKYTLSWFPASASGATLLSPSASLPLTEVVVAAKFGSGATIALPAPSVAFPPLFVVADVRVYQTQTPPYILRISASRTERRKFGLFALHEVILYQFLWFRVLICTPASYSQLTIRLTSARFHVRSAKSADPTIYGECNLEAVIRQHGRWRRRLRQMMNEASVTAVCVGDF
ncbi:hypothetical protein B0H13DRAFT_2308110 [Mycena leptocephala]|nr:hypothetical protein B0H13DRAFT_2308110 [Mycena leptocephala]